MKMLNAFTILELDYKIIQGIMKGTSLSYHLPYHLLIHIIKTNTLAPCLLFFLDAVGELN